MNKMPEEERDRLEEARSAKRGIWHFTGYDETHMLEIRHANHDMLRRCRCKRMERSYLRLRKARGGYEV